MNTGKSSPPATSSTKGGLFKTRDAEPVIPFFYFILVLKKSLSREESVSFKWGPTAFNSNSVIFVIHLLVAIIKLNFKLLGERILIKHNTIIRGKVHNGRHLVSAQQAAACGSEKAPSLSINTSTFFFNRTTKHLFNI